MKWLLALGVVLITQLSHAANVIYQSAAYGANSLPGDTACSSTNCPDYGIPGFGERYFGEFFSISSDVVISHIDFHKGIFGAATASLSDITIAFYDVSNTLVYSQTFNSLQYIQTEILSDPSPIYNINATFTPFSLGGGDYTVYYFGDSNFGVPVYSGFGLVVSTPSQSDPYFAFGSTAVRLSGSFITTVPEPESFGLFLMGLGLVGLMQHRKKLNS